MEIYCPLNLETSIGNESMVNIMVIHVDRASCEGIGLAKIFLLIGKC